MNEVQSVNIIFMVFCFRWHSIAQSCVAYLERPFRYWLSVLSDNTIYVSGPRRMPLVRPRLIYSTTLKSIRSMLCFFKREWTCLSINQSINQSMRLRQVKNGPCDTERRTETERERENTKFTSVQTLLLCKFCTLKSSSLLLLSLSWLR